MKKVPGIILSFLILSLTNSAKILVILPSPSYSHNTVYRTVYKELSLRGHDVVAFTAHPLNDKNLKNLREIDIKALHVYPNEGIEAAYTNYRITIVDAIQDALLNTTKKLFMHPEMQNFLQDPLVKFDLLMVEWSVNPSYAALSKRFNCPMIGMRALGLRLEGHDSVGNPTNPSYIPIGYMNFEKNFWGRLDNFLFGILWRLHHHWIVVPKAQELVTSLIPNYTDSILETEKQVSIIFTNTHPVLTKVRPLVPAIIEIGGIHLKSNKQDISEDIKMFLDNAKEGVIYFNLGTFVRTSYLETRILNIIMKVLDDMPYKTLLKWESKSFPYLSNNVKVSKWLPQEIILEHPNVKVFITHCGLLSFMEAVDNNIPLVGIPFAFDQHMNCRTIETLKIGKELNIQSLTSDILMQTIKNVIENPVYKKNIKRISKLFHDLPKKPLEKAIWWVEYILRHKGSSHLRSPAVDETWISYLLLDIIGFLLISFIICIIAFYCIVVTLYSLIKVKMAKVKTQ